MNTLENRGLTIMAGTTIIPRGSANSLVNNRLQLRPTSAPPVWPKIPFNNRPTQNLLSSFTGYLEACSYKRMSSQTNASRRICLPDSNVMGENHAFDHEYLYSNCGQNALTVEYQTQLNDSEKLLQRDNRANCPCDSPNTHAKSNAWREKKHNLFQKLASDALGTMETALISFIDRNSSLPSTVDPSIQLAGNFAPVSEHPPQHNLPITGKLPPSLNGIYVRNGANPQYKPTAGHHFFDGDGMVHAVRFKQGNASYCCRFTRTHRLVEEQKAGRTFFPKAIGELHGHGGIARLLLFKARSLCGLVDDSAGMGVANAGLIFFNGRLLAMSEDDLPYCVSVQDNGELSTIGRFDFHGQLSDSMIAHPKKDPQTGELFTLSYDLLKQPYLKYYVFSADGQKLHPEVAISLPQPTMIHDFAITQSYVVIPDQQVVFKLHELLRGGSPVVYDESKPSRFGILPKYDTDERRIKWIEVPNCFCFHLWNAWEEDKQEIVVIGSCMTPPDSIFNESEEEFRSVLCEIRLNMRTGSSTKRNLASKKLEAGQINLKYLGRKSRYAYLAIAQPWPKISGIAKVDLQSQSRDAVVATFMHGQDCYGGEPFFVPRSEDHIGAAEDDGFLLTFMHNEKTGQSELLILDASLPCSLELLASVKLPSRVPYGFHGTFLTSKNLAEQVASY
ncbi:hypothetical protein O6H91_18G056000 [Diphasiastrum complanatum]|uniref:Uncharacterized protein n=1 Tax=Diphasiastrum complanatum TaxID=34168 RepID=A0ACC2B1I4_DIPCM|nr:hypothetical protein O6H91_18G056000 [Diphasiastrum complanatum]